VISLERTGGYSAANNNNVTFTGRTKTKTRDININKKNSR